MNLSVSSSSSSSSMRSTTSSSSNKSDDKEEERHFGDEFSEKMRELEAAWVGCVAQSRSDEDGDAAFISNKMEELRAFMEEHREHLGADMMPRPPLTLLDNTAVKENFYNNLLPMLQNKSQRDECSVEKVYKELVRWTFELADAAPDCQIEDLVFEACRSEAAIHKEWVENGKTKPKSSSKRRSQTEDIQEARATHFKPLVLAHDKDSRNRVDAAKKIAKRAPKVSQARANAPGWKNAQNKVNEPQV